VSRVAPKRRTFLIQSDPGEEIGKQLQGEHLVRGEVAPADLLRVTKNPLYKRNFLNRNGRSRRVL
jgi:hypothetical protein